MKVLLIGKTGQLGQQLQEKLGKGGYQLLVPSRVNLDLARPAEADAFIQAYRPEVVINTAAFHNASACEEQSALAFEINALAVKTLAEASAKAKARFLTFSTDYVFDGEKKAPYLEFDQANPLQVYGNTKLAGESLALAAHPQGAYVIRTCGVFGARGGRQKAGNSIEQRILEAGESEIMEVGADQMVSPTYAVDLAEAVSQLIEGGPRWNPGIYHLVNEGQCTWLEFAVEAFRLLGKRTKVKAVNRAEGPGSLRRPLFSALANERAAAMGVRLPHWKNGLARFLGIQNLN